MNNKKKIPTTVLFISWGVSNLFVAILMYLNPQIVIRFLSAIIGLMQSQDAVVLVDIFIKFYISFSFSLMVFGVFISKLNFKIEKIRNISEKKSELNKLEKSKKKRIILFYVIVFVCAVVFVLISKDILGTRSIVKGKIYDSSSNSTIQGVKIILLKIDNNDISIKFNTYSSKDGSFSISYWSRKNNQVLLNFIHPNYNDLQLKMSNNSHSEKILMVNKSH